MPRPDPFILILLATVGGASLFPVPTALIPGFDLLVSISIVALFFLHGVRLRREALIAGLTHWRLHGLILVISFLLFPLLGLGLKSIGGDLLPAPLWLGLLYVCILPSTVQSSVAFTSIAGGNVAAATCAAALSNIAGVVITPLLAGLLMHVGNHGISGDQLLRIALLIFFPFLVGHALRRWLGGWADRQKRLLGITDRGTILLSVYSAFSAAVTGGLWHEIAVPHLLILMLACLLILAIVLAGTTWLAAALGFAPEDRIVIVFTGSKKSMASGVPMARILFPASMAGPIILPVLLFHQIQLMACSWIAQRHAAARQDGRD